LAGRQLRSGAGSSFSSPGSRTQRRSSLEISLGKDSAPAAAASKILLILGSLNLFSSESQAGVLPFNKNPDGQVKVGFRDGFGTVSGRLPVHDLISQSVNQPGLAFGPVSGPFHGLIREDLARG
jgi:hypothetical protein